MNTKKTIQKILVVTAWLVVTSGMVVLLVAAIGSRNRQLCRNYSIVIKGVQNNFFVDKQEIERKVKGLAGGKILSQSISAFNLRLIEKTLEEDTWIRDAELFFDNNDVLHITVHEREPVARIITTQGHSFYLDTTRSIMPLSDKMSARVPVFTGFPDKVRYTKRDSALMKEITVTADFVLNNSFWMAQVAQIDIISCGNLCWEMEMIPTIGNHIVKLGSGQSIEEKFNRLFVFYKKISAVAGFDAYASLDVRFKGQVVAGKENKINKSDSTDILNRINRMIDKNELQHIEPIENRRTTIPSAGVKISTTNPYPSKAIEHPEEKPKQIPKALMKSRNKNTNN